ncbi:uncharacterized protein HD556DRAFT_820465 [Suillus plorans]|uniref:Uncharacterized protein n=1 Tax=Suillus plorans TaxID=116603 RepID=A0A9P7AIN7_9AGAM|nr:uncharacterized protein HD556DRAFT_820465 [Suillus plorans]KAG1789311.1 hypothetical protein HD556DRAFT_820465 [Suillus plorans]
MMSCKPLHLACNCGNHILTPTSVVPSPTSNITTLAMHPPDSVVKDVVDELIIYYSECLFVLRALIPLFRAHKNTGDSIHTVATKCLPRILQDSHQFALDLITEYLHKTEMDIPEVLHASARIASRWAKQNMKERLVTLEVLFWTVWGYVPCDGPLIVRIFETAYNTNLGSSQKNSTLLLDDEGNQLQHDRAALWILVAVEVLELERVAEDGGIEISATPSDKTFYPSSPESLRRIHEILTSNLSGQHARTYLAWAFILSRLTSKAGQLKEIPESYRRFLDSPHLHHNCYKEREPSHVLMARAAFSPEAGLFKLFSTLLTTSPLFVTSVAWKTGSTVTDPNAITFRSVLKGFVIAMVELVLLNSLPTSTLWLKSGLRCLHAGDLNILSRGGWVTLGRHAIRCAPINRLGVRK